MSDGEPGRGRNSVGALAADAVTVSVYVEVSPADAFDVFMWWAGLMTSLREHVAARR